MCQSDRLTSDHLTSLSLCEALPAPSSRLPAILRLREKAKQASGRLTVGGFPVKHPKALVAIGYSFIEDMVKEHGYVVNYISLANRPAIRYIKGVRHIGLVCETKEDGIGMHFKIRRGTCAGSQG